MPKQRSTTRKKSRLTPQKAHERAVKAWRTKHLRYRYGSLLKGMLPGKHPGMSMRKMMSDDGGDIPRDPRETPSDFDEGGNLEGLHLEGEAAPEESPEMPAPEGAEWDDPLEDPDLLDIADSDQEDPAKWTAKERSKRSRDRRANVALAAAQFDKGEILPGSQREIYSTKDELMRLDIKSKELETAAERLSASLSESVPTPTQAERDSLEDVLTKSTLYGFENDDPPIVRALALLEYGTTEQDRQITPEEQKTLETFARRELINELQENRGASSGTEATAKAFERVSKKYNLALSDTKENVTSEARRRRAEAYIRQDPSLTAEQKERMINNKSGLKGPPDPEGIDTRVHGSVIWELVTGSDPIPMTQEGVIVRDAYVLSKLMRSPNLQTLSDLDFEQELRRKYAMGSEISPSERREQQIQEAYETQEQRRAAPIKDQRAIGGNLFLDKREKKAADELRIQRDRSLREVAQNAQRRLGNLRAIGSGSYDADDETQSVFDSWIEDAPDSAARMAGEQGSEISSAARTFLRNAWHKDIKTKAKTEESLGGKTYTRITEGKHDEDKSADSQKRALEDIADNATGSSIKEVRERLRRKRQFNIETEGDDPKLARVARRLEELPSFDAYAREVSAAGEAPQELEDKLRAELQVSALVSQAKQDSKEANATVQAIATAAKDQHTDLTDWRTNPVTQSKLAQMLVDTKPRISAVEQEQDPNWPTMTEEERRLHGAPEQSKVQGSSFNPQEAINATDYAKRLHDLGLVDELSPEAMLIATQHALETQAEEAGRVYGDVHNESKIKKLLASPGRYLSAQGIESQEMAARRKNLYERGGLYQGINIFKPSGNFGAQQVQGEADIGIAPLKEKVVTLSKWEEVPQQNLTKEQKEKKDEVEITTTRLLLDESDLTEGFKEDLKGIAKAELGSDVDIENPKSNNDGTYTYTIKVAADSSRKRITPDEAKAIAYRVAQINQGTGERYDKNQTQLFGEDGNTGPVVSAKRKSAVEMRRVTEAMHPDADPLLNPDELHPLSPIEIRDKLKRGADGEYVRSQFRLGSRDDEGELLKGERDQLLVRLPKLPGQKQAQVGQINLQERTDSVGFGLDYRPGEKEITRALTAIPRRQQELNEAWLKTQKPEGDPDRDENALRKLAEDRLKLTNPKGDYDEEDISRVEKELAALGAAGSGVVLSSGKKVIKNKAVEQTLKRVGLYEKAERYGLIKEDLSPGFWEKQDRRLEMLRNPFRSPSTGEGLQIHMHPNGWRGALEEGLPGIRYNGRAIPVAELIPDKIRYRTKMTALGPERVKMQQIDTVRTYARNLVELQHTLDSLKTQPWKSQSAKAKLAAKKVLMKTSGLFHEIDRLNADAARYDEMGEGRKGFDDTMEALRFYYRKRHNLPLEPTERMKAAQLESVYQKIGKEAVESLNQDVDQLFGALPGHLNPESPVDPAGLKATKEALDMSKFKTVEAGTAKKLARRGGKGALIGAAALGTAAAGVYAYDKYRMAHSDDKDTQDDRALLDRLPDTIRIPKVGVEKAGSINIPTTATTDALDLAGKSIPTYKPAIQTKREIQIKNKTDIHGERIYRRGAPIAGLRVGAPKGAKGGSWVNSVAYKKPVGGSKYMLTAAQAKNRKVVTFKGKDLPFYVQIGDKERTKPGTLKTKNPNAMTKEEKEMVAVMLAESRDPATMAKYGDIPEVADLLNDPEALDRAKDRYTRITGKNVYGDDQTIVADAMRTSERDKAAAQKLFDKEQARQKALFDQVLHPKGPPQPKSDEPHFILPPSYKPDE